MNIRDELIKSINNSVEKHETIGADNIADEILKNLPEIVELFAIPSVSVRLVYEKLKKANDISPIVGALGYKSSYDLGCAITNYRSLINCNNVENVVRWMLDKGFEINKPHEL